MDVVTLAQWGGITASLSLRQARRVGWLGRPRVVPGAQVHTAWAVLCQCTHESLDLPNLWIESLPLKLPWQGQFKCDRKKEDAHGGGGLAREWKHLENVYVGTRKADFRIQTAPCPPFPTVASLSPPQW